MFILLSEADCRPYICLKLSLNIQLTLWLKGLFCKHIIEPWTVVTRQQSGVLKHSYASNMIVFKYTNIHVFIQLSKCTFVLSNLSESSQWEKKCPFMFSCEENLFLCEKGKLGDWREDLVVKTICCSWKGPRFSSHIHHSQLLVTAVLGNLTPSFGLHGHLHVHSARAHIHKRIHKEVFLKEKLSNWSLNFYSICINVWAACVLVHHVCA